MRRFVKTANEEIVLHNDRNEHCVRQELAVQCISGDGEKESPRRSRALTLHVRLRN